MDVVVERVAGLDIGKASVTVCVRVPGPGARRVSETRTYSTMTRQIQRMADWLDECGVELAAMESTATYWKPVVRHEALRNRVAVKGRHRWAVAAVW